MDFDLFSVARELFAAVMGGQWALVAALALVATVFVLRKYVSPKVPFLASDAGGVLLAFVGSAAGGMATAFAAGQPFTWALLLKVVQVAFLAMGGFAALKKFLAPLAAKAFEWLKSKLAPKAA